MSDTFSLGEHRWMARALQLARRGLLTTRPNPRVGCLLIHSGAIVAEGWHERAGGPHAEIMALEKAGAMTRGATAILTLEPCGHHGRTPPCDQALIDAGVRSVVVAMEDPNPQVAGRGLQRLRDAGLGVRLGLMEAQAEALNAGFVTRMRLGRPRIVVKLASSLDGRTAMANGESRWITGGAARADVHRWRAASCAILTGIGTVRADDPRLTPRDVDGLDDMPPPLRVVLDSRLRMSPRAAMLQQPGTTLVITASDNAEARQALEQAGAEVARVGATDGRLDLTAVMQLLGDREINDLLVEAGAELAGALLQSRLADELVLYQAPHFLGGEGRPLVELPGLEHLGDRVRLKLTDTRMVGDDLRLQLQPVTGEA
ncbi:bifunctional diaminohydroxyphosphoribosylaminopyrimidine deaminase/5-amino-6-(5-phosphoribosylamino)uracil reductase RibD [Methylonatrum kenyense]|uniref:bifunctional diaminohydroxyphosphoribosylaminopyrimidine deaminase/5-amino-6-(5-phosphoribosylamino)uracil reductase RibD n=1 Tax=Methylonatrum kenyense TaxID=455253 RepID=UPI0020C04A5E|nr:bifunctional diaminohydroxyphosphoribosylaminopyrimidine deaminase/5-amino-6-(5-phosphoribosylamino)uracil reductase RibD [Methylonatrum kenyense]MCK8517304.1 bifunctional diaminohydroxyphosphoribosylaminopyrimidine deaminase/5-amino-6-(5-phosphoribosylamino)uracil reductase RibD [Methylonatrum kenyense]